jgi:hypothetical protein
MSVASRLTFIILLLFLVLSISSCATKDGTASKGSCMKSSCAAAKVGSSCGKASECKCVGCPYKSKQGKSSCGKVGSSCGSASKGDKKSGCGRGVKI